MITDYIHYGAGSLFVSPILFIDFIGLVFIIVFFIADGFKEEKKNKLISKKDAKIELLEKEIEIINLKLENKTLQEAVFSSSESIIPETEIIAPQID